VRLEQPDHPAAESDHALDRRRARPERWLASYQRVLELPRPLVEQGHDETGAVAEAAEQRALPDAGLRRDRLHRDVLDAVLLDQLRRRREDAAAVASGVRTLTRLGVDGRKRQRPGRYDVELTRFHRSYPG
jgi:hypothetical protein